PPGVVGRTRMGRRPVSSPGPSAWGRLRGDAGSFKSIGTFTLLMRATKHKRPRAGLPGAERETKNRVAFFRSALHAPRSEVPHPEIPRRISGWFGQSVGGRGVAPMDRGEEIWRERAVRDAVLAGDGAAWRGWYDAHFPRLAAY